MSQEIRDKYKIPDDYVGSEQLINRNENLDGYWTKTNECFIVRIKE